MLPPLFPTTPPSVAERGILPEAEIIRLICDLESESALVSYKQNTDGTTSPDEINITYLDTLNRRWDSDKTRLSRFIIAHVMFVDVSWRAS